MIDVHSHVLPNIDDGSKSIEMSRKIFEQYQKENIKKVICTPHQNVLSKNFLKKETIHEKYNEMIPIAKEYGVELFIGSEIYFSDEVFEALKRNELLTLNDSKYILLEFSQETESNIEDAVYELGLLGFKIILAHAEKYYYLKIEDIINLKHNGVLIQVNSDSFEKGILKKKIIKLLKLNAVDFIASDTHNDTDRKVCFKNIKKYISKKFPKKYEILFNK